MLQYRTLIANAFRFSARHRFLWILAVLVALGGAGDELELIFSGTTSLNGQASTLGYLRAMQTNQGLSVGVHNAAMFLRDNALISITVGLLFILGFLLLVWLVVVAQGGLVWAIDRMQGKDHASVGGAFAAGMKVFSPVFLVNLIARAIVLLLLLAAAPLGYVFVRTGNMMFDSLYILVAYLALIPIAVLLGFLAKFAVMYIVLRNQRWTVALRSAWELFVRNWLITVEMALVLLAINSLATLLFTIIVLSIFPLSGTVFLIYLVLLFVVAAYLSAFSWSAWVMLFDKLEKGLLQSKIVRLIARFQERVASPPVPPTPTKTSAKTS